MWAKEDVDCYLSQEGSGSNMASIMAHLAPYKPHDRKPIEFWAIDVNNETVCKASNGPDACKAAYEYQAAGYEVEVRHVKLNELDYRKTDALRREEQWATRLYKPTPQRRAR